jgi:hypothetical protein
VPALKVTGVLNATLTSMVFLVVALPATKPLRLQNKPISPRVTFVVGV